MLTTPNWYESSEPAIMFNEVVDTQGMCYSDHLTVRGSPSIDRTFNTVKIEYEGMATDIIDGTKHLVIRCSNFRNPIY